MICIIDIGNSNIVVAFTSNGEFTSIFRIETDRFASKEYYTQQFDNGIHAFEIDLKLVENCGISSSVPELIPIFKSIIAEKCNILSVIVSGMTPTRLINEYENPSELGPDRLANAVGGFYIYGAPVVIVDMGTATTFNVVLQPNRFVGGLIIPGLKTSLKGLLKNSALPDIELKWNDQIIATNTKQAMQNGALFAYANLLDGTMRDIWKELGYETNTVMTGGISNYFVNKLETIKTRDELLTLKGILQIVMDKGS